MRKKDISSSPKPAAATTSAPEASSRGAGRPQRRPNSTAEAPNSTATWALKMSAAARALPARMVAGRVGVASSRDRVPSSRSRTIDWAALPPVKNTKNSSMEVMMARMMPCSSPAGLACAAGACSSAAVTRWLHRTYSWAAAWAAAGPPPLSAARLPAMRAPSTPSRKDSSSAASREGP